MNLFKHLYYKYFCNKIVKYHLDYKREKFNDRNVLESIIFPYVLSHYDPKAILDIGREDYQAFYNDFFAGRESWTLDMNPEHREFGAEDGKHILDNVINLKQHFSDNKFDFILMNGVFGWGLNDEKDVQIAFNAIYDILKPGGIFILGYNEEIVPLKSIDGLNKMKKIEFPPLKKHQFTCVNGNHTYNFYTKA